MEEKLSWVAKTIKPSPIQQLSFLADCNNAVNLAAGFPDFPALHHVKAASVPAINSDFNQYRHVQGICDLVADKMKQMHGLNVDPLTDIAICSGQSEIEFVEELIKQAVVVAVPGCGFFHTNHDSTSHHNRYIRFAFCKSDATLASAAHKMEQLVDASGHYKLFDFPRIKVQSTM